LTFATPPSGRRRCHVRTTEPARGKRRPIPSPTMSAPGGLVCCGPDSVHQYRRAASHVDRIFKGETPANLPVQMPVKYWLTINLRIAKALALIVPTSNLLRADEVIELVLPPSTYVAAHAHGRNWHIASLPDCRLSDCCCHASQAWRRHTDHRLRALRCARAIEPRSGQRFCCGAWVRHKAGVPACLVT
jgi:hypothetical protein